MKIKIKIYIFSFIIFLLFPLFCSFPVSAFTKVDTFRVTDTPRSEKWTTIYKDTIYWLDPDGLIRGFDTKSKQEFLFFEGEQPFKGFLGLVAYDGRYIIYNRFDGNISNVNAYDTLKNENISVTEGSGSRWASDYDKETIVYIDGGACGKIYIYNLTNKNNELISESSCGGARISNNIVVWGNAIPNGSGIFAYDLGVNKKYDIAVNSGSFSVPDIFDKNIVWVLQAEDYDAVYIKNLNTGREEVFHKSSDYHMNWPSISERYVIWGKNTGQHVSGVEGIDIETKEVFEIQEQGPHQNDNLSPIIEGNIAAWMAWRTGNGDIYASVLTGIPNRLKPLKPIITRPTRPPIPTIIRPIFPTISRWFK